MADAPHELEPHVSPALSRDLGQLFDAPGLHVPPAISERILNRARAELIGRSRRRLLLRWAGAAAAAAVVVLVVRLNLTQPDAPALHASAVAADVDGSGRVDILDALVLARRIESNRAGTRDLSGDGIVDRRDVDAIATRAVSLQRGGVR